MDLSLDWLWRRLPSGWHRFDDVLELAHFTIIINAGVISLAMLLAHSAFLDPVPDVKTFAVRLLWLSFPIWCLTFSVRYRNAIRRWYQIIIQGWRRGLVRVEPPDLWDEWLGGPTWNRSRYDR